MIMISVRESSPTPHERYEQRFQSQCVCCHVLAVNREGRVREIVRGEKYLTIRESVYDIVRKTISLLTETKVKRTTPVTGRSSSEKGNLTAENPRKKNESR